MQSRTESDPDEECPQQRPSRMFRWGLVPIYLLLVSGLLAWAVVEWGADRWRLDDEQWIVFLAVVAAVVVLPALALGSAAIRRGE